MTEGTYIQAQGLHAMDEVYYQSQWWRVATMQVENPKRDHPKVYLTLFHIGETRFPPQTTEVVLAYGEVIEARPPL